MIGIMYRYSSMKSKEMHMTYGKMKICDSEPGRRYTYNIRYAVSEKPSSNKSYNVDSRIVK